MNQNHRPQPNSAAGLSLPKDVAQQRAAQQQMQQQVHAMLLNLSGQVLCQLVRDDASQLDRLRQRTEESDESHRERLTATCDQTAAVAAQYAESLLHTLGVTKRPETSERDSSGDETAD